MAVIFVFRLILLDEQAKTVILKFKNGSYWVLCKCLSIFFLYQFKAKFRAEQEGSKDVSGI